MMASMTTSLAATAAARSSSRLPTVTSVSKRGEKNAAGLALRAPSRPAAAILLRAALVAGGRVLGGDVQQPHAEAGVGQVRRDGRPHDACSQYRHFA